MAEPLLVVEGLSCGYDEAVVLWEGSRRQLEHAGVNHNRPTIRIDCQDGGFRIDEDRNLTCAQRAIHPAWIHHARGYALHRMRADVDRLRKRDGSTDGQRLGQLADHDLEASAVKPQGDPGGEVAAAAQENQVRQHR